MVILIKIRGSGVLMITYKKLANTNYDVFLSVCIWLYHVISDLEYQKEEHKKAGNISEFKRLYYDIDLKRYKRSFNTAKNYLKNSDYYYLAYMSNHHIDNEISQKMYNFLGDKFGY